MKNLLIVIMNMNYLLSEMMAEVRESVCNLCIFLENERSKLYSPGIPVHIIVSDPAIGIPVSSTASQSENMREKGDEDFPANSQSRGNIVHVEINSRNVVMETGIGFNNPN